LCRTYFLLSVPLNVIVNLPPCGDKPLNVAVPVWLAKRPVPPVIVSVPEIQ